MMIFAACLLEPRLVGGDLVADPKLDGLTLKVGAQSFVLSPTEMRRGTETVTYGSKQSIIKQVAFMPVKLRASNLMDVSVTLTASGKKLRRDVDFFVDPAGAISPSLPNVEPVAAVVDYTFLPERYDALFRAKSGELVLKKGRERVIDAEEYIPDMEDAERIVNINVRGDVAELVHRGIPKGVYVGKEYLDVFLSKLAKGRTVKVLGYGDSITATELSPSPYTPGGANRDRAEAYFYRFDAETKAKLPVWERKDYPGHFVKAGWSWGLVDQLERDYGVRVEWLNAGIGSTNTGGGLKPERLKAAMETNPDWVVLSFGMNERGSKDTYRNTCRLIEAFKSNGAAVVVVSVPRCQGTPPTGTNAQLAKAAFETKTTFVNLEKVEPGILPRHYCAANQYNHPGIAELRCYREALASLVAKK